MYPLTSLLFKRNQFDLTFGNDLNCLKTSETKIIITQNCNEEVSKRSASQPNRPHMYMMVVLRAKLQNKNIVVIRSHYQSIISFNWARTQFVTPIDIARSQRRSSSSPSPSSSKTTAAKKWQRKSTGVEGVPRASSFSRIDHPKSGPSSLIWPPMRYG